MQVDFRKGKAPQRVSCEGKKKKSVRYIPVKIKVRKGGGDAGAAAQIPLQPMEESMVEQRKKI